MGLTELMADEILSLLKVCEVYTKNLKKDRLKFPLVGRTVASFVMSFVAKEVLSVFSISENQATDFMGMLGIHDGEKKLVWISDYLVGTSDFLT